MTRSVGPLGTPQKLLPISALYRMVLLHVAGYPVGHFGGNQLLGGSMSLSPPCETPTSNLHVSTATIFQTGFPVLRSGST